MGLRVPTKAKLRTVAGPLWLVYLLCGSALIGAYYPMPRDRMEALATKG
jgi:hypothetical protein